MNLKAAASALTMAASLGSAAVDLVQKADTFVQIAEDSNKTGVEKLAAVKAAILAYVTAKYPSLVETFETLWGELAALISGLVALYHALGVFKKAEGAPAPA